MTNAEFKAIRKRLGLTQKQLAEVLGYRPLTISSFETGRRPVKRNLEVKMMRLDDRRLREMLG